MQIDRIYYPVETLGYGKRIGIWTIGCPHHCEKCSNPELWTEDKCKEIDIESIVKCVKRVGNADGITITGGDPFYQADELLILVSRLRELGYEDILVYSGYTYEELIKDEVSKSVLDLIAVLIDGKYVDSLNDNRTIRGSSNQRILVLNSQMNNRYSDVNSWERKTQIVMNNNDIHAIGIPLYCSN